MINTLPIITHLISLINSNTGTSITPNDIIASRLKQCCLVFQLVSGMLAIDKLNKRVYTRRIFGLMEWMGVLPGSQEVGTIAGSTWSRSFYKKVPNCHSFAPELHLHVAPNTNTFGVFTEHTELYAL